MTVVIDVRDLIGQPGASRTVRLHEAVPGLGMELAEVPESRPVDAELLLESVVDGILVSGPLRGEMALACARCLQSFPAGFEVAVQELFAPGSTSEEDEYPLGDGEIDLEPMIRDAVLLAMPFAPLCRPDCLGLCERCGGDRNLGECTCSPDVDMRWAPLAGLRIEPDGAIDAGDRGRPTG